jgi:hypothetical protein
MQERVAGVDDVAAYEAMMAEVQQNPGSFANPAEDLHPDDQQQAQPAGEDGVPPEGEAQPEGEHAEAAAEGEQGVEGEGQEGEPASQQESEGQGEQKPPQFRLRPTDKVDAEALRIMKAAEAADAPITLSESLEIARNRLGVPAPQTNQPAQGDQQPQGVESQGDAEGEGDPTETITLSEAKQELKDLRKAHSQALRDGDLDEAADVMDKIGDTEDLIEVVAEREANDAQTARQTHDSAFEQSVTKATDLYPDFGNEQSEFYERCTAIDEALRDTGDPRYYDADKPVMIAQMAAKELNIAPGTAARKPAVKQATQQTKPAAAQPQQASSSPQPPRTERPGQLPAASGASRTAGTPTGAAASLAKQVEAINSTEEFEALAKKVHQAQR